MVMKQVKVSELKAKLSKYLRLARSGEEVIVLDRNLPIARMIGLEGNSPVTVSAAQRPPKEVWRSLPPLRKGGITTDSLSILTTDRRGR